MKSQRFSVAYIIALWFLAAASGLQAAPWAVAVDAPRARIVTLDFGTTPPTVYGPFLEGQLGRTNLLLADIEFTPDGNTALVTHFQDMAVYMVNLSNPTNPVVAGCVSNGFFSEDISISPDGRHAIVTDGSLSRHTALFDLSNFTTSIYYATTSANVSAVSIAPDNQTVVCADYNGKKILCGLVGPTGLVTESVLSTGNNLPVNVAVSPDGRTVLAVSANTNTVNVFRLVGPGQMVTGVTATVTGLGPVNSAQSVAFSPRGDRAYVVQNRDGTNVLSWLQINGPGNVTLGGAGVARLRAETQAQLFGVDTIAISPDGRWALVGNPSINNGRTNVLSLINLEDFTVSTIDAGLDTPVGVAFAWVPGYDSHVAISPQSRAPVVRETVTFLVTVTNTGYQAINPAQLAISVETNLVYAGGQPVADENAFGVVSWTNVGPLAIGGCAVVTAQFTAVNYTLPGSITNMVAVVAHTFGGWPLPLQVWSGPLSIANNIRAIGADFDGDGLADPALYDAYDGTWRVKLSTAGYFQVTVPNLLGGPTFAAMGGDFDGDGLADPAVYEQATGNWGVLLSSANYYPVGLSSFLGGAGWFPAAGDFDGDRVFDPGVCQENSGSWKVKLSTAGYYEVILNNFLGQSGFTAVPGDYDGDRVFDPAAYGRDSGTWLVMLSSAGYSSVLTLQSFLGGPGWQPVPADFNGDRVFDPAVKSESSDDWIVRFSGGSYDPVPLTIPFQ